MLKKVIIFLLLFLLPLAYPIFASITVYNKTDYRIEVEIKDTRNRYSYALNPDERESFSCSKSGGLIIIYKKQEEQAKKRFDDGDIFTIKFENNVFTINKENTR